MNLKLIYGLIFGLFGFVAGGIFVLSVFFWTGFLWDKLFQDGSWPTWSGVFFRGIAFLSLVGFVFIEVLSIRKGFSFGNAIEKKIGAKSASKRTAIYFAAAIIVLSIFVQFTISKMPFITTVIDEKRKAANMKDKMIFEGDEFMGLYVKQTPKGLRVDVNVLKSSVDVHRLSLELSFREPFWEISENIDLLYSKQKYVFIIPYSKILQSLEGQPGVLNLKVEARLETLFLNDDGSVDLNEEPLLVSEIVLLAEFFVHCLNDDCDIIQAMHVQEFK